jgi:preprotein translocase subunit SecB
MKIQIVDSEVIGMTVARAPKEFSDDKFNFSFKPEFDETNKNQYFIVFTAKIAHHNKLVYEIVYRSTFATEEMLTEDFMASHFVDVNSPAIAYPFFRACVANIMLVCGHEPMMLPTINFSALREHEQKDKNL